MMFKDIHNLIYSRLIIFVHSHVNNVIKFRSLLK